MTDKRVTFKDGKTRGTMSAPIDNKGTVKVTTATGTRLYTAGQVKRFIGDGTGKR